MLATDACGQAEKAVPAPVLGEARSWQREGGGAFTAALRGVVGGKVILQSADGRSATLDLTALSRNDRDYVRGKMGALAQRWLALAAAPAKPAADRSGWPAVVRVPQESLRMSVERPFAAGSGMRFASAHFEFDSPVEVLAAEQRSIATPFELIHEVWRLAPWGVITPPKVGGLFQVELFLHTAAYESAGGLPDSGCHFDQQSKRLRVLGSAIGLDPERKPLWRDEQSPTPALSYGIVPLMTQDVLGLVPEYIIPALALVMRDLPARAESAWPGELVDTLAAAGAEPPLTKAEVSAFFYATGRSTTFPPLEPAKLRRILTHFIVRDGGQGRNLGEFLAAAAADHPLWEAFNQRLVQHAAAVARSKDDPATVIPEMPSAPHGIESPAQIRTFHLNKLLRTEDVPAGVRQVMSALQSTP